MMVKELNTDYFVKFYDKDTNDLWYGKIDRIVDGVAHVCTYGFSCGSLMDGWDTGDRITDANINEYELIPPLTDKENELFEKACDIYWDFINEDSDESYGLCFGDIIAEKTDFPPELIDRFCDYYMIYWI